MQRAAEDLINGSEQLGPKGVAEAEAARSVVTSFMHEMECILHEYLSYNWDRADEIYTANEEGVGLGFHRLLRSTQLTVSCSQMHTYDSL